MEAIVGPRGEYGWVPKDLVGLAYSALHSWEKFQLRRYEIRRDICVTCHDDHHPWYTCQYRIANAQHSYRRKLKAIAQGHKTIKAALTGGFAKLPAELRLQIFTYAFDRKWKYRVAYSWRSYSDQTPSADDNAIVVRPGYIPFTIRKSGLPFLETMQAWLSVNCVELNPRKRPWSSVYFAYDTMFADAADHGWSAITTPLTNIKRFRFKITLHLIIEVLNTMRERTDDLRSHLKILEQFVAALHLDHVFSGSLRSNAQTVVLDCTELDEYGWPLLTGRRRNDGITLREIPENLKIKVESEMAKIGLSHVDVLVKCSWEYLRVAEHTDD